MTAGIALRVELGPELSQVQHRIALGVQCVEALTGRPLLAPLRLTLKTIGPLAANLPLQAKGGGRYSLVDAGAFARLWNRCTEPGRLLPRTLDLLAHEDVASEDLAPHRHGPRRVLITLASTAEARPRPAASRQNTFQLRLFPGPSYPFDGGATLLRGRVQLPDPPRAPKPARWARLVAVKAGRVVGATQADERGEYALLLRYPAGLIAPATPHVDDGAIELRVAARGAPPAHQLPFDDLAAEDVALAALDADPWANLPAGYDRRRIVARTLQLGRPHSGPDFDFLLAP
jgi:hypothetical protein